MYTVAVVWISDNFLPCLSRKFPQVSIKDNSTIENNQFYLKTKDTLLILDKVSKGVVLMPLYISNSSTFPLR